MKVHIPAKARPAAGGDGHMAVIDQAGGQEYDFWQVATNPLPAGGGTINISWGGRTPIGGSDATGPRLGRHRRPFRRRRRDHPP